MTVALANDPGGATLGGRLSATASDGVATFSGLTLTKAGSGYTILISSNGLSGATTSAITITPAPASQLLIKQQPPDSVTAGSGFGLKATIEDPYGNVEAGDSGTVTVALADNPTGTTLGGTLSAAAKSGVASFSGLTLTAAASGYTLQVTGGTFGATTAAIAVTPAAPAKLIIATEPSSTVTAGAGFGLTVDVFDPYGNLATLFGGVSVAIATGPGGATLGGQTTAIASGGVATFAGLTLTRAGSYTLQASGLGVLPVTIDPIAVTPASPGQLVVTTPPPGSVSAGTSFGLVVSSEDRYGNPTPSFSGEVSVSSSNSPLKGTTTVSTIGGIAGLAGLTLDQAGVDALTVVSAGLGPATTGTITVTAASAVQLTLVSEPPGSVTAGAGFGLAVEAQDPFGNLATSFNGIVTAALSADPGNASLGGPATATTVGGVATIAGLTLDMAGSGYTIEVTSGSLTGATSGPFTVTAAAASQLVITTPAPSGVTAGDPFGLSVAAEDLYGNVATAYSGPVTLALSNNPVGGTLNGALTTTASNGVVTFSGLTIDTAVPGYAIAATSGNLSPATIGSIAVAPAAASRLVVLVSPPTNMTVGADFGLAISADDPYGNRATGFTGNVTIALATNPGSATLLGGPLTVAALAGVANFPAFLTLDTAASGYTIEATSDGLMPVITGGITVAAVPPTHTSTGTNPGGGGTTPAQLAFAVGSVTVDENAGDASIQVLRSGGTLAPVSVEVDTAGGTAVAGVNYRAINQTLNFAAGQDTQTITIPVIDVGVLESDLTVNIVLSSPGAGAVLGSPSTATLVIESVPQSSALPPLVTMNSVQLIENKRGQVIEILVGFSGGLNVAEAENTATYLLTVAGRDGSFTAKGAEPIQLRSAVYNASKDTVALFPKGPISLRRAVQLQVKGQPPSGLHDSYGRYIDGNRDGQAGSNAVAILDGSAATVEAIPSRTSALNRLLTNGKPAASVS